MEYYIKQKTLKLNHVLYEMDMYLITFIKQGADDLERNLLAESHLLHLRNLLYFFSTEKTRRTDIIFDDILCDINLSIDTIAKQHAMDVVSKAVSHLSMARVGPEFTVSISIEVINMIKVIPTKIEEFIDALPSKVIIDKTELDDPTIKNTIARINSSIAYIKESIESTDPNRLGYVGSRGYAGPRSPSGPIVPIGPTGPIGGTSTSKPS